MSTRSQTRPLLNMDHCDWRETEDAQYDTSCGHMFELSTGTPAQNKMKYCPYCGRTLRRVAWRAR